MVCGTCGGQKAGAAAPSAGRRRPRREAAKPCTCPARRAAKRARADDAGESGESASAGKRPTITVQDADELAGMPGTVPLLAAAEPAPSSAATGSQAPGLSSSPAPNAPGSPAPRSPGKESAPATAEGHSVSDDDGGSDEEGMSNMPTEGERRPLHCLAAAPTAPPPLVRVADRARAAPSFSPPAST